MVVKVSKSGFFRFDWQHAAMAAAALTGAIVCFMVPDLAKYAGPIVSGIVPLALAKKSPLDKADHDARSDDDKVTVINIGTPPQDLIVEDGDIRIKWQDTSQS
jgi:hypothetical protein